MEIQVPFTDEKELRVRFENWLIDRGKKFKKKGTMGNYTYVIKVEDAQDAYWIGCNVVSLLHRLFDGPLTKTLA